MPRNKAGYAPCIKCDTYPFTEGDYDWNEDDGQYLIMASCPNCKKSVAINTRGLKVELDDLEREVKICWNALMEGNDLTEDGGR